MANYREVRALTENRLQIEQSPPDTLIPYEGNPRIHAVPKHEASCVADVYEFGESLRVDVQDWDALTAEDVRVHSAPERHEAILSMY